MHFEPQRPRLERIGKQDSVTHVSDGETALKCGQLQVGDLCAQPGRETFAEPNIVPPCLSHEVAEPLMRQFVCHHFTHPSLPSLRVLIPLCQKDLVSVYDQPRVLDAPEGQLQTSQVVEFFPG